ncbi:MAG TPA: PilN domain-containing protein [Acetobacteraceae bacterium]|nr:PilN domain-containing protein [Acetobacteraceae bacterium]
MLVEFLTWWRQQLLDLVPEALRGGGSAAANALVADATENDALSLVRRRRDQLSRVATVRLDEPGLPTLRAALNGRPSGEPVVLRVPPRDLLERTVALPLAAERELERVLTYDMERLTPFAAEEVFWAAVPLARDRARGRLTVRLSLIPRAKVQALLDLLADCGGRPSLLEAETDGGPRAIRLAHTPSSARLARLNPRTAAYVLAGMATLVVASPFLHQSLDMTEAQHRLDTLAPRMREVDALRRRIASVSAGGDAVARETARLGDMLEALAAITEILPDDSYLTEFTMRERKMTLSGLSASAPRLISALSSDPRIKNPAFTAPVTKDENNHKDVFSIRAELAD